eukprot:m.16387 g.16387  ORF g.16387 m.16387 type:complete len:197 (+) comp28254_c0_seq1:92-682(+)
MGSSASALDDDEVLQLVKQTGFSAFQVRRLFIRFQKLDKNSSGLISAEDMLTIPELAINPISDRIIQSFGSQSNEINFRQFADTLSAFLPASSLWKNTSVQVFEEQKLALREKKLKFLFKLYDVKNDGIIDSAEMFAVLKLMVGPHIDDDTLGFIVGETMKEADPEKHSEITFAKFSQILATTDLDSKLSINFDMV